MLRVKFMHMVLAKMILLLIFIKYIRIYVLNRHAVLRRFIDTQAGHCDDIAFNFIVASITGMFV